MRGVVGGASSKTVGVEPISTSSDVVAANGTTGGAISVSSGVCFGDNEGRGGYGAGGIGAADGGRTGVGEVRAFAIVSKDVVDNVVGEELDKSMGGGGFRRLRFGKGVSLDRREWGESASACSSRRCFLLLEFLRGEGDLEDAEVLLLRPIVGAIRW